MSRLTPPAAVWMTAVAAAVASCGGSGPGAHRPVAEGDRAPEYGARSLQGDSVDLAALRGRPVLLNLWATWCVPCRQEMPDLQALHEQMGDRLQVVGVSIDAAGARDQIHAFLADAGVDFPIWHDPGQRFVRRFTTVGVPETFLLDAEGVVRHLWIGRFSPLDTENVRVIERVANAP